MSTAHGDECVEWCGAKLPSGYGTVGGGKSKKYAHRVAWEKANGRPVPDGMFICHDCDNPSCVNPEHLYAATPAQNSKDMVMKGRSARGERNGGAKLTLEQVNLIRSDERTYREIASEYGVSQTAIWKIKNRMKWND
jgi:hypothetical protein